MAASAGERWRVGKDAAASKRIRVPPTSITSHHELMPHDPTAVDESSVAAVQVHQHPRVACRLDAAGAAARASGHPARYRNLGGSPQRAGFGQLMPVRLLALHSDDQICHDRPPRFQDDLSLHASCLAVPRAFKGKSGANRPTEDALVVSVGPIVARTTAGMCDGRGSIILPACFSGVCSWRLHFLRTGLWGLVLVCLLMPFLLLVRPTMGDGGAATPAALGRIGVGADRGCGSCRSGREAGEPWMRLAIILGSVTAFTAPLLACCSSSGLPGRLNAFDTSGLCGIVHLIGGTVVVPPGFGVPMSSSHTANLHADCWCESHSRPPPSA